MFSWLKDIDLGEPMERRSLLDWFEYWAERKIYKVFLYKHSPLTVRIIQRQTKFSYETGEFTVSFGISLGTHELDDYAFWELAKKVVEAEDKPKMFHGFNVRVNQVVQ